jgi:hypothetical protein
MPLPRRYDRGVKSAGAYRQWPCEFSRSKRIQRRLNSSERALGTT